MFGKKFGEKNKAPKIEAVFLPPKPSVSEEKNRQETSKPEATDAELERDKLNQVQQTEDESFEEPQEEQISIDGEEVTGEEDPEVVSAREREKIERLDNVQDKISKILKSGNIEIIDENAGDTYEYGEDSDKERKQQEDYDSLKAIFGSEKAKNLEITVTTDEFDYTYVGQYVDELDILHIKNIKHVKLQTKHSKLFKWLTAAAAVVIAVIVSVVLSLNFLKQKPVYLVSISLNKSTATYFLDEEFLYSGRYIIANYSDGTTKRIELSNEHFDYNSSYGSILYQNGKITFTSGASSTVRLAFSYQGHSTSLEVNVLQKYAVGVGVIFTRGLFELTTSNGHITEDYLILFREIDGLGAEKMDYSDNVKVYVTSRDVDSIDGVEPLEYSSTYGYLIPSNGINSSDAVWVEYNGYRVKIIYTDSGYISSLTQNIS